MKDFALTIFFPAFNEAQNLPILLENTSNFINHYNKPTEVIVVNDGSKDDTETVLKQLEKQYSFLRSIHHPINLGYGSALRSGFDAAQGNLVFFMDSDNQFKFDELSVFLKELEHKNADGVIGQRINRQDHFVRKLNTFLWCTLVKNLLNIKFKDIDCAYKLFKKELIKGIQLETTGAMISTELLFKVQKRSRNILQLPVKHYPRTAGSPTGANPFVIFRAFKELFLFYFNNVIKK